MLNQWFALPVAALLAGLGLHFGLLRAMRGLYRRNQRAHQTSEDSETAPGQLLLGEIDRVAFDIKAHRVGVLVPPLLLLALVILYRRYHSGLDYQFLITAVVACGIAFFYCFWHLIHASKARRRYLLKYDAENEVGQAIDDLVSQGYFVSHGLSTGNFSIDHIVVGPKGVFTIEAKGHPRPSKKTDIETATVTYNGHVLFFPKSTDEKTVPHAVDQADQLSEWLGEATGEPVSARAIVAIPGWLVKRTTSDGVPVVNPSQFPSLFEHIKSRPLTRKQIDSIVEHLQQ